MARVKIEDEVVDAVFSEKDDFRLSVRGMTLIEACSWRRSATPSRTGCRRRSKGSIGRASSLWRRRSS